MFGISAPRMAVRAALPWYWRGLGLIGLVMAILLLSRLAYDFGREYGTFSQGGMERDAERVPSGGVKVEQEIERLRAQLTRAERQLQMERATYADLVKQMKSLTDENAVLKEDLAFFQTLMPAGSKDGGVAINRFLVQNDALPGEYRYRLLLTQTGQRAKEFEGKLQFVVNLQQDSKKWVMTLPAEGDRDARGYKLSFRFYQRIEGTFRVAPNAAVKSVQVRIFESGSGEPRLSQTANPS